MIVLVVVLLALIVLGMIAGSTARGWKEVGDGLTSTNKAERQKTGWTLIVAVIILLAFGWWTGCIPWLLE